MEKFVACALVVTILSGVLLGDTDKAETKKVGVEENVESEKKPSKVPDEKKASMKFTETKDAEPVPKSKQQVEVEKKQHDSDMKRHVAEKRNLKEVLGTEKVSVFFTETPLSQVLSFLGDLTEIDFIADLENGVDPLITIRVNSMTLRNVLNWIATLSRTRWGLKDEAVYFSRKTAKALELRFYHIRDLLYEPPDFPGSDFTFSDKEGGGFKLEGPEEEESKFDPETLIKFIKNIEGVESTEDKKTK